MDAEVGIDTHDLRGAKQRAARKERRRRTAPIWIALAAVGGVGFLVGGVYLALMRVPAAPPRTQQIGSVRATFSTDPRVPWSGPAEVKIWVVDAAGAPVSDAEVIVGYEMETDSIGRRMAGMGPPSRIAAHLDAPGLYVAPVNFTMAGQWALYVAIARGGRQEGQGRFLVTVR